MWPVVKEFCDHACWIVVLVRCNATGRILAYCWDCGAVWPSPADLAQGAFAIGSQECPRGIEIPTREDVAASLRANDVLSFVPESEFSTVSEINRDLARKREGRRPGPALQPPRPVPAWLGLLRYLLGV